MHESAATLLAPSPARDRLSLTETPDQPVVKGRLLFSLSRARTGGNIRRISRGGPHGHSSSSTFNQRTAGQNVPLVSQQFCGVRWNRSAATASGACLAAGLLGPDFCRRSE